MEEPKTSDSTNSSTEQTQLEAPVAVENTQPVPNTPEPATTWEYSTDNGATPEMGHAVEPVTWTASEFIDHEKQGAWFVAFAGVVVVIAGLIYLITKDVFTVIVVVIAAILFGITAGRKPNTLEYRIDAKGIKVGEKLYEYHRFKSFSVIQEGALNSIQLLSLSRVAPPLSLYFPPDQEERIVGTLADYLPHEDRSHDAVDRLMRRIRF